MEKLTIYILFTLSFFSCNTNDLEKFDSDINYNLQQTFDSVNDKFWYEFEQSFLSYYNLNKNVKSENNKYIYNIICNVATYGGFPEDEIELDSLVSKEVLKNLSKIEVIKFDKFNYDFFYLRYNSILKKHPKLYPKKNDSIGDLLIGMSISDPKLNDYNLALISKEICDYHEYDDFEREGLYKSIVILYFGNLICNQIKH